jgi:hypothetical protein
VCNLPPKSSCTSGGPGGNPTIPYTQTAYDVFAYGVANATTVDFLVWSDVNGQDDLISYPGTNQGGGTWKATINPARNSDTGQFQVDIWLNGWETFCWGVPFVRAPQCTPSWGACSVSCGTGVQYDGCGGSRACTVSNCSAWWQVKDGDVTTNGDINISVPSSATVPYFDDKGSGGYPGIPAYGGSTGLTGANVSVNGWLAAFDYSSININNSIFFLNSIPADTNLLQVP